MPTYDKNSPCVVKGAGYKLLQQNNPFLVTDQKKGSEKTTEQKTTEQKPVSMPVGGDIETEEDMELFLDGMRSEEQEKADRSARARLKYSARPEVRQGLIDYNEAQLKEKSRQGIFERVFAEEYKKDPEKAHLKAWEAAENTEYDKSEVERLQERIRELKFATDIENAGRMPAQVASEKAFAEAKASGHLSPAAVSMQRGDEVMAQYNDLAKKARNDLFYHNLNNQIAGHEEITKNPDYAKFVARGETDTPDARFTLKNRLGKELVNYINDPNYPLYYTVENNGRVWDAERFAKLTEEEKDVIRAYASMGDYATVEEYYKLLERDLNERVQNEKNEKSRDFSYEQPFWAGVGNVASSFVNFPATLANAGQAIKNRITGEFVPTDGNSPAFRMTHFKEQSEDGVGEWAYDFAGGGERGEIAESIARGGLSVAGDLAKNSLGGWGILLNALDKSAMTTHNTLQNGKDPSEALWRSTVSGVSDAASSVTKIPFNILVETPQNEFAINDGERYNEYVNEALEAGVSGAEAEFFAFAKIYGPEIAKEIVSRRIQDRFSKSVSSLFLS